MVYTILNRVKQFTVTGNVNDQFVGYVGHIFQVFYANSERTFSKAMMLTFGATSKIP